MTLGPPPSLIPALIRVDWVFPLRLMSFFGSFLSPSKNERREVLRPASSSAERVRQRLWLSRSLRKVMEGSNPPSRWRQSHSRSRFAPG